MILKQKLLKIFNGKKIKLLIGNQGLDTYSKCPPKLFLHSSTLFLVCRTIFRISSSLMSAAQFSTMPLSSLRVLETHLNIFAIETKMRSLETTSPESMGASGELSYEKLFYR